MEKHANLGIFWCDNFLFRNSGHLDHVSSLSTIIYLLEVTQILGMKPKKKEIASVCKLCQTQPIVWKVLLKLNP